MAKKSFRGINGILGITQEVSAPETSKDEFRHTTYLVRKSYAEAIKNIAFWDRRDIYRVVDSALHSFIHEYEKDNDPIKPRPPKERMDNK